MNSETLPSAARFLAPTGAGGTNTAAAGATEVGMESRVCIECGVTFFRRANEFPSSWNRPRLACGRSCGVRRAIRQRVANFAATHGERFWSLVEKTDTCWLWRGDINKVSGYGRFGGKKAHRLAYEFTHGPIDDDALALHECDVRACVRPEPGHVYLGDALRNARDRVEHGRHVYRQAALTPEQIAEIRARRAAGERNGDIAVAFGVCYETISRVVNRRTYA